jgi:hypothetical protein
MVAIKAPKVLMAASTRKGALLVNIVQTLFLFASTEVITASLSTFKAAVDGNALIRAEDHEVTSFAAGYSVGRLSDDMLYFYRS